MASFLNVQQPSDVMAVINHLREWSESQRQKFLNKQLIEHKKLFEQSGIRKLEQQINFEHLSENSLETLVKDGKLLHETEDRNLLGSNSSLQDSSITGHILHCFSDTSYGSSTLDRTKDDITDANDLVSSNESNFLGGTSLKKNEDSSSSAVAIPLKRPKQPFLKKRSGLLRYLPKQNTNVTKFKKPSSVQDLDSEHPAKPILKLNPSLKIGESFPQKVNHVKFIEHEIFISNKESNKADKLNDTPEISLTLDNEKCIDMNSSVEASFPMQSENSNDEENNYNENMEKKELAEFELLENCAQNSSFNSDSSIVHRVLQGESNQPLNRIKKPSSPDTENNSDSLEKLNMDEVPVSSERLNLGDFLEEQRKQGLEDIILDTYLRTESLNRKTSNLSKDVYGEKNVVHERCSTPVDLSSEINSRLSPVVLNSESSADLSSSVIFNPAANSANCIKMLNIVTESDLHNSDENGNSVNTFQNKQYSIPKSPDAQDDISDVKEKLCQRRNVLEKEIETYQKLNSELQKELKAYQEQNSHLASIRFERDENLKKLQKSWNEFQKHKEDEEKKLEDKRRQLKMREETFNRYQKLRKDNPNRKEREELMVLRQEVDKLQEELKRQRIRFTNENKRLKNQLIAAEQERDCLKLENITLEEQCQDLLATLKSRHIKKKPEVGKKLTAKKKEISTSKNHQSKKVPPTSPETITKIHDSESSDKDDNSSKSRVRFNLIPQFVCGKMESFQSNSQTDNKDVAHVISNTTCEISEVINETPPINESNKELPYEEIKHDNQIERIYFSGEKEIIRPSGIVKHISADGKTVTYRYPNGDIKEVYPDNSIICKFITGVIEKRFPGGIEVTEHPNGQIEKRSPGLEEVKFPDGTTQTRCIFPDGSEKIEYNDGTKVIVERDGTEIAQFKNGVKEIRTAKYKRKEYPDGSVKIIYEDGSQETRYSNGRVKKKDKDGRILLDTKILQNEFNFSFQGSKCS